MKISHTCSSSCSKHSFFVDFDDSAVLVIRYGTILVLVRTGDIYIYIYIEDDAESMRRTGEEHVWRYN